MSQTKCRVSFPGLHEQSDLYGDLWRIIDESNYHILSYGETKEGRYFDVGVDPGTSMDIEEREYFESEDSDKLESTFVESIDVDARRNIDRLADICQILMGRVEELEKINKHNEIGA